MILYILIAFFVFIGVVLYDFNNYKKGKTKFFYICFVLFWLYSGLRYRVGTDSFMYESMFDYIPQIGELKSSDFLALYQIEPLWIIFNSLIKTLWNDFVALELVCSFLLNYAFFDFVKKNTSYIFTAIFVYFLLDYLILNCEFIRQSTAVALYMIFALPLYEKHRYFLWFVVTFTLCFMHNTMFFCLLIPLMNAVDFSKKKTAIIFLFGIVLILNIDMMNFLMNFFSYFLSTTYKISAYSSDAHITVYNFNLIISKLYSIVLLVFLLSIKVNFKYKKLIILYCFSIALSFVNGIFARLQYVLFCYYLLLYSDCLVETIKQKKKIMKSLVIFVAIFTPTFTTLNHKYDTGLYNYQKYLVHPTNA